MSVLTVTKAAASVNPSKLLQMRIAKLGHWEEKLSRYSMLIGIYVAFK
jgi:hypothetical protein